VRLEDKKIMVFNFINYIYKQYISKCSDKIKDFSFIIMTNISEINNNRQSFGWQNIGEIKC